MIRLLFQALLWPLLLPLTLVRWSLWRVGRAPRVLELSLEGLHPHRPTGGFAAMMRPVLSRRRIRRLLLDAARDRRVSKVQLRVGPLAGGWASLFELRQAVVEARAAGLTIEALVAWADTRTLWLASAADRVHLAPDTFVLATGVGAEMTFFGESLERLGVELEVVSAGTYKSAMEPFTRTGPTEANREAIDALLDDLYGRIVADVAAGRGLSEEAVRAAFDEGPYGAATAVARGLADAVTLDDEFFADELKSAHDYRGAPKPLPRWRPRPRLAVVEVRGAIRDGAHEDPAPQGATIRAVVDSLDAATDDKRVKGVLLHVDSPGGSAVASERMWHAVRRLAEAKPVVVWMGDAAASGGYYVASAAHAIVAAPGTLTGSVGVIFAKPVAAGLLSKLGLHRVRFERGPASTMFSPSRGLSDPERDALKGHIEQAYGLFLERVCAGRERDREWLEPIAEGRVWTGQQALHNGLVDALGTEADALRLLAEKAGVDPDVRSLRLIQPKRGMLGWLRATSLGPTLDLLRLTEESSVLAWCPVRLR